MLIRFISSRKARNMKPSLYHHPKRKNHRWAVMSKRKTLDDFLPKGGEPEKFGVNKMNKSTAQLKHLEYSLHDDLISPLKKSYQQMSATRKNRLDNAYHCKKCDKVFKASELYKNICIRCCDKIDNVRNKELVV